MDIFNYSFMVRAFIVGIAVAIAAPLIGTFLVTKGYSLLADTLAHICLAGIALGLFLNVSPFYVSIVVVIVSALVIENINHNNRGSGEATLALFLSGGLAVATVIISVAKGFNSSLFSYLFGSIATVSQFDAIVTTVLSVVIVGLVLIFYKELKFTTYDEESAQVSGLPVRKINKAFMIITAVTIALSIRTVGILLVSALMIIPVLSAAIISKSIGETIRTAVLISITIVIVGLMFSYYFDLAAGGTIVLFGIIAYISIRIYKSVIK